MVTAHPAGERLDSWKSIAAYLKCNVRTAMRWEKERGLPVRRIPGGQRQGVFAWPAEINQWLANELPIRERGQDGPPAVPDDPRQSHEEVSQNGGSAPEALHRLRLRGKAVARSTGISVVFLLLVGSIGGALIIRPSFALPTLGALRQITHDGLPKEGLLVHGRSLYFGEERDGRMALCSLRVGSAEPHVLWSSATENILPEAVSPDGTKLLAFTYSGVENERPLWVVSLNGSPPRRLGTITGHSAAWSPDGTQIAFAEGTKIYLSSADGTHMSLIGSWEDLIPERLKWSSDGAHLRLQLVDPHTLKSSLWQIALRSRPKPPLIVSLPFTSNYSFPSSQVPGMDASVIVTDCCRENTPIWLLRRRRFPWQRQVRTSELKSAVRNVKGIAYSKSDQQLFLLSDTPSRSALLRFDPHTGEFGFILPGVSGVYLSYSRNRQWVTYTRPGEETLWVSRADGSEAKQLTASTETVELPRISPDGRWIAYMAKLPGKQWRIYIQQSEGSIPREASDGIDSQGAPTWSPDGKFLMYGNVECQTTQTCAIHIIDLATGRESTLPGSGGLETARWSPNGAYLAALRPIAHQLVLFDFKIKKWRTIADDIDGNDVDWSPDSNYVYASCLGSAARIIRVKISDGRLTTAMNFARTDPWNLSEVQDTWFAVAPDGSIILRQWQHSSEIFSYGLKLH